MTWEELGNIINGMSKEERKKDAIAWDYGDKGYFYTIHSCTAYDEDNEPGVDFSCSIDVCDGWR